MFGKTCTDRDFSREEVTRVWLKAKTIPGYDTAQWRMDACGKIIARIAYADPTSAYGWEIDHIKPKALDGTDDLSNLQPLQCKMNREKDNVYPWSAKA